MSTPRGDRRAGDRALVATQFDGTWYLHEEDIGSLGCCYCWDTHHATFVVMMIIVWLKSKGRGREACPRLNPLSIITPPPLTDSTFTHVWSRLETLHVVFLNIGHLLERFVEAMPFLTISKPVMAQVADAYWLPTSGLPILSIVVSELQASYPKEVGV